MELAIMINNLVILRYALEIKKILSCYLLVFVLKYDLNSVKFFQFLNLFNYLVMT